MIQYITCCLNKLIYVLGPNTLVLTILYEKVAYLQFQHKVHTMLSQWVDVIQNEGNDDVYAITLMTGNSILYLKI